MLNISFFKTEATLIPSETWQSFGIKRPYNADYKTFQTCLTPKNILIQSIKGACLPLLLVTKEMEQFNKERWEASKRGEEVYGEEFDLHGAIKKQLPLFYASSQRFIVTSIIRKGYDLYALLHFSAKMSDMLCKDVNKSAMRKLAKYGRAVASGRMLRTLCYGNFLNYLSGFTYDILLGIWEWAVFKKTKFSVPKTLSWLAKKCMFYSVLLSASSAGYCLGTLIGDRSQVTSGLISILVEAAAADWATRQLLL